LGGPFQVGWKGYIDDKAGDGVENNCFHEQSQGVHNLEVDQNPSLPLRQSNTEIVIWRDGEIFELSPDEATAELEANLAKRDYHIPS
jgi:hypothetical protein